MTGISYKGGNIVMTKNPYEILGISEGASMDEIKRAYRKKAKEYHPDLHPDDPAANEKMQQVNQAYDMLCNPDKYRAQERARPHPKSYGGYGRQDSGGYAGHGQQHRQGNWQYTYYSNAGGQDPWAEWQNMWSDASGAQREQHSAEIVRPFRGIFRVIGGILLFRFIVTLLRFGLFGFFF